MITYEQACDIVASAFPGAVFSAAFEYPGGWVINVEPSVIVHRSDGEWKYFDVGNPEFLDVLGIMKRIALPDKYAAMIRPKGDADKTA